MSVEKLSDLSRSILEKNPFAQISNEVIEHIKDNDAFRLYAYLSSKSREWKVIKTYAESVCDVGNTKAKKCWSYLARCVLIEYRILKDENNKIIRYDLLVLNGTRFNKDEPFLPTEKLSTSQWVKKPPTGESTPLEKSPLLNKDLYQINKKLQKRVLPDQKKNSYGQDNVIVPNYTDWTQERLDREASNAKTK